MSKIFCSDGEPGEPETTAVWKLRRAPNVDATDNDVTRIVAQVFGFRHKRSRGRALKISKKQVSGSLDIVVSTETVGYLLRRCQVLMGGVEIVERQSRADGSGPSALAAISQVR